MRSPPGLQSGIDAFDVTKVKMKSSPYRDFFSCDRGLFLAANLRHLLSEGRYKESLEFYDAHFHIHVDTDCDTTHLLLSTRLLPPSEGD